MALGKIQTQIVAKLEEWGRLTAEQRTEIVARPEDFSGEALDKLLQDDYKVAPFQLLTAKARALGMTNTTFRSPHGLPPTSRRISEGDLTTPTPPWPGASLLSLRDPTARRPGSQRRLRWGTVRHGIVVSAIVDTGRGTMTERRQSAIRQWWRWLLGESPAPGGGRRRRWPRHPGRAAPAPFDGRA